MVSQQNDHNTSLICISIDRLGMLDNFPAPRGGLCLQFGWRNSTRPALRVQNKRALCQFIEWRRWETPPPAYTSFFSLYALAFFRFQVLYLLNKIASLAGTGGWAFFIPIPGISKTPFGFVKQFVNTVDRLLAFSQTQNDSHMKNLDPDHPNDLIDQYLIKLEETQVRLTDKEIRIIEGNLHQTMV